MTKGLFAIGALAVVACSGSDERREPADADAALGVDAGASDAGMDRGDGGVDPGLDAGFGECAGACATTDALATFGSAEERFDVAYFGVETDGRLRIEMHGDAAPGCPTMSSPTPGRTLVVHGLSAPMDRTAQSEGLSVTLFDFDGTLTPEPLLRAESATVTPVAFRLSPSSESFVAFAIEVTFASGSIAGHGHATHCASLDGP